MTFANMVTNSVLLRFLAALILFLVMVLSLGIATYDLLVGRAIPQEILTILGIGLGTAMAILGINYGVGLQPQDNQKSGGSNVTP